MKKNLLSAFTALLMLMLIVPAYAISRDTAIEHYTQELSAIGVSGAGNRAEAEVDALIQQMEGIQQDTDFAFDELDDRVNALPLKDSRKDSAESALKRAKDAVESFTDINAGGHVEVHPAVAGALPRVSSDENFDAVESEAQKRIGEVRKLIIAPSRPGGVPTGDIVSDFIPQIIRQMFRFAWVAVLIALSFSGVKFVLANGNDEELTKAKGMIWHSMVGFAFIALSFALVKAVTDIDFFRFI